jgi:uncharacterized repeat protein (TIGR03847 family)
VIELDPVDRLTADAVGPPGQRTFYLQGRKGDLLVTVVVEKQQVELLAASVLEVLSGLGSEVGEGPPEEAMGLEDPVLPEWRAGRLVLGYDQARGLLFLEAEELVTDEGQRDPDRVRFWATKEQMLSLARHGHAVCARGRPTCQLCGNPIDPSGHACPALDGHGERTEP